MGKIASNPVDSKRRGPALKSTLRFQKAIESAEALSLIQRESLVDVLTRRNADARRLEIETEIRESLNEYDQGHVKHGTLDELLADLDS